MGALGQGDLGGELQTLKRWEIVPRSQWDARHAAC